MRIVIAAIGRLKTGPEADLIAEYLQRARPMGRAIGFSEIAISESETTKGLSGPVRQAREGELLVKSLPAGARMVALDASGEALTSQAFATLLSGWRDQGAPAAALVIGGADGLADSVKKRAEKLFAFGRATFPHLLVRVMLVEQTYRAMTILSGHPYHRA